MSGADGIVTVGCGARQWRIEGFEDAFAALASLAPWLGASAAGDEAGPPDGIRAQALGDAVVLRPAEAAGARCPFAAWGSATGLGWDGPEEEATEPPDEGDAIGDALTDAFVWDDAKPSPAAADRPAGAEDEAALMARIARMVAGEDEPSGHRPDAPPAGAEAGPNATRPGALAAAVPIPERADDADEARAPATQDRARGDGAASQGDPKGLRGAAAGNRGAGLDRIVVRLAEATAGGLDVRDAEPRGQAPGASAPGRPAPTGRRRGGPCERGGPGGLRPPPDRPRAPRQPAQAGASGRGRRRAPARSDRPEPRPARAVPRPAAAAAPADRRAARLHGGARLRRLRSSRAASSATAAARGARPDRHRPLPVVTKAGRRRPGDPLRDPAADDVAGSDPGRDGPHRPP